MGIARGGIDAGPCHRRRAARNGDRLIVIDVAYLEVTNAIWKQHYRGLITLDEARLYLDQLLACPVQVEPAHRLLRPGLEIAAKYHRAAYDALFVALAQDLGLNGVTADEPLHSAVHGEFPNIVLLRNWKP